MKLKKSFASKFNPLVSSAANKFKSVPDVKSVQVLVSLNVEICPKHKLMRITLMLIISLSLALAATAQINFSTANPSAHPLLQKMDSLITAGKYERITSVLVIQNSNLVFEKYYQGKNSNSRHNTRSATKTLATILTGIAIDKGYIESEQDYIFKYLKANKPVKNPDPRKDSITIEDLLTMSSVLECDDFNNYSRGHEERMYFIEDWTQFLLDLPIRSYPFNGPPSSRPYGRAFAYASAKSAAVGDIVERAIGQRLDSFAIKNLFKPLGINEYTLHYSPKGVLNTAGGSEYRSRDLAKLIQLLLNKGRWEEQQIISSDWIAKATTPKAHAYDIYDYGYFLWLGGYGKQQEHKAFFMSGNGGNKVMAIPSLAVSIVITSTNYNNRNAHNYADEIISNYIVPSMMESK